MEAKVAPSFHVMAHRRENEKTLEVPKGPQIVPPVSKEDHHPG